MQLSIDPLPWQKFPEAQVLDHLKQHLLQSLQQQHKPKFIEKATKALACCDEVCTLVALHHSVRTSELSSEELQAIQENAKIDSVFSAIEENTGEMLGGYAPQILGPAFNDLFNIIPDSYNPLLSISSSLVHTLKKLLTIITGISTLAITSTNYFMPSTRALLQTSTLSEILTAVLYYRNHPLTEQIEDGAKEITQLFLEIICSYGGMKLFGTDESFNGYFHKIVPALLASKTTEFLVSESCMIASFALPLLVSSIVYNQADIRASLRESSRSLRNLSTAVLNGEFKKQILQPIASSLTSCIKNNIANMLSQETLRISLF